MSKPVVLALLLALSLFTFTLTEGHVAADPAGNTNTDPEVEEPCPIAECEGNCLYDCMRTRCPDDCVNEEKGCDEQCKRGIMKQYFMKQKQAYVSTIKGAEDADSQINIFTCAYEECKTDDGCDFECVRDHCPADCMDDTGSCDRVCKFNKMMEAKGMMGGKWPGMKEHMKWRQGTGQGRQGGKRKDFIPAAKP
ncbi:uncharacterized protein [Amphiura filiformis]|uniref:uncharacterized protein n=1 Tax=Amphiura filiformis TaxID=82378 RepID=UPI003B21872C